MKTSNTFTVAVGRSWHQSDNSPAPDHTCGHAHKTLAAAVACGKKLYASRYVHGSWTANAHWHDWYVVDNTTGQKAEINE